MIYQGLKRVEANVLGRVTDDVEGDDVLYSFFSECRGLMVYVIVPEK